MLPSAMFEAAQRTPRASRTSGIYLELLGSVSMPVAIGWSVIGHLIIIAPMAHSEASSLRFAVRKICHHSNFGLYGTRHMDRKIPMLFGIAWESRRCSRRPTRQLNNAATGVHHASRRRRRGGSVAACGASAAGGDAGDWAPQPQGARRRPATPDCVRSRSERRGLCRGPER